MNNTDKIIICVLGLLIIFSCAMIVSTQRAIEHITSIEYEKLMELNELNSTDTLSIIPRNNETTINEIWIELD